MNNDDARDQYMQSWKGRAEEATRGNQSRLGALLIAILGRTPTNAPMFAHYLPDGTVKASTANITSDGYVMCDFIDRNGMLRTGAFIGHVSELVANFRGLADHLKLSDADRKEMFDEVRKWIAKDWRAKSDANLF